MKLISSFFEFSKESFKYILYYPLKTLYFNGPRVGNVGFWNGKFPQDICAQLTSVPSYTWTQKNLDLECFDLLEKNFNSFYISILFVFYIYTFYIFLQYTWYRFFIWKPMIHDIEKLLENSQKQKKIK